MITWTQALFHLQGSYDADRRIVQLMSLGWLAVFNQSNPGVMRSLLINQHEPFGFVQSLDYHGVQPPENLARLAPAQPLFFPVKAPYSDIVSDGGMDPRDRP
jgi:hypothetical protein